jgi:hypothetical protein
MNTCISRNYLTTITSLGRGAYINAGDLINALVEPDQKRRLNDVKLYWLYYFILQDYFGPSPQPRDGEVWESYFAPIQGIPQLHEYLWKGQMAYMIPMGGVVKRIFGETTSYGWLKDLIYLARQRRQAFNDRDFVS